MKYLMEDQDIKGIANAIREKSSTEQQYLPNEMSQAIRDIPSDGDWDKTEYVSTTTTTSIGQAITNYASDFGETSQNGDMLVLTFSNNSSGSYYGITLYIINDKNVFRIIYNRYNNGMNIAVTTGLASTLSFRVNVNAKVKVYKLKGGIYNAI